MLHPFALVIDHGTLHLAPYHIDGVTVTSGETLCGIAEPEVQWPQSAQDVRTLGDLPACDSCGELMDSAEGALPVTYLGFLPGGEQLIVQLAAITAFHLFMTGDNNGRAVVRPVTHPQSGVGDMMSLVECRPYVEGAKPDTQTREEDDSVLWGYLVGGYELVMKNLEGGGTIMYCGRPIESIALGIVPSSV